MTRRTMLGAIAVVVASVGIIACDSQESVSPTAPSIAAPSSADASRSSDGQTRHERSLRVTKDCTDYHGLAGDTCTINYSSVDAIEKDSKVVYATGAGANGFLDTDVMIVPPGRGRNVAFGHCALDLVTGDGRCTFSGGTGKFRRFRADAVVSHLTGPFYAWNGTYSFGSDRD